MAFNVLLIMEIKLNKEQLQERIDQIKNSQDAMRVQFTTLQGHLDEANFWLKTLDESKPEEQKIEDVQQIELEQI